MVVPIYRVSVPEYNVNTRPDWDNVGSKIDLVIKKHFLKKRVVIRCLSSKEHRGKSIENLIAIIRRIGHDRYNPRIKGDRYDNIENKRIDIFALDFKISKNSFIMQKFIEPFYTYPKQRGKNPIRLDLVIIYDRSKLKRVIHTYDNVRRKTDGFIFKEQDNKKDALLGFIKIF